MKILLLLTFIFQFGLVQAQPRSNPKILKTKGDFVHASARTVFPEKLQNLARENVYSFDKKNQNIGVVYKSSEGPGNTTLSIYIYPAGDGTEGRLRNEYSSSLQSIAYQAKSDFSATQFAVRHEGEKYICNGFKAIQKSTSKDRTELTLFECGKWFFKVRFSTNTLDSLQSQELYEVALQNFDPSKLTALNPLDPKVSAAFLQTAFRDSTTLGASMGSAFKKIEWATDSVADNEAASGFPDLYLNLHKEAIKAFVAFDKKWNTSKGPKTQKYLDDLNAIIDAGFLTEFILDEYGMIMIVPKNTRADFDGYYSWRKANNITATLKERFYILSFKKA